MDDASGIVTVEELREVTVNKMDDIYEALNKGEKNRSYGETKMNERSSRSHTIFRIIIESSEKQDKEPENERGCAIRHVGPKLPKNSSFLTY